MGIHDDDDDDEGFAICVLEAGDTGIHGLNIHVLEGTLIKRGTHREPHIRLATKDSTVVIASICIVDGRMLEGDIPAATGVVVGQFLTQNRAVLIDYWQGKLSTKRMLAAIQPIKRRNLYYQKNSVLPVAIKKQKA